MCFFVLLLFPILFCFFPGKKQTKCEIKAKKTNQESKKHANGQVHWFPIFSLFDFPFFPPFFPLRFLLLCFLDFADLLFVFSIVFAIVSFFSSLLILRISCGLVNINKNHD